MGPAHGLLPGSERMPFTLLRIRCSPASRGQRPRASAVARRAGLAGSAVALQVLVVLSAQAACRATPCWGPSREAAGALGGDDTGEDPFEGALGEMQQSLLQTRFARPTLAPAVGASAAERLLQTQQSLLETQQSLLQMQQSLLQSRVNQRPPPSAAADAAEPPGGAESIDLHSLMQNGFELVASPTSLLERLRALLRDGLSVGERILRLVGPSGNLRGRRGQALASGPESSRDVGVVTANTSATAARPDIAQGSLETHLVRASDEAWQPAVVPRLYASLAVVSTLLVAGLKCAQVFGGSVCGFRAAKAPAPGDDVAGTRVQLAAAEVWGPVPRLLPEQPAGKVLSFRERLAELAAPPPLQGRPLLA